MSLIERFLDWWDGKPSVSEPKETLTDGFLAPLTREALLSDEHIKHRLTTLKRSGIGLPYEVWDEFVVDTIVAFSQYTQELPASEHHHHAYKRGLLLHSLDVAIYALRIRRNYALPPLCAPEDRTFREIVWVYGVFIAALLHDAGKVFDFEIQLLENKQQQKWDYTTPITQPYRFRYLKSRHYDDHKAVAHSLLSRVLSQNPMRALTHDRQLWNAMSDFLTGQAREDNVFAEIVQQADAASVAQDLGAEGEAISIAAENAKKQSHSLGSQLQLTLKHLLGSGKIPLNRKGAEGFIEGDMAYLICKPVADLLRRELTERGLTHVPSDNSKLFNELQHYALIESGADGQAVVRVEVSLSESDWTQPFTCIKANWRKLLPDAELPSLKGSITLLNNDVHGDEATEPQVEPQAEEPPLSTDLTQEPTALGSTELNEDLLLAVMGMASPGMEPQKSTDSNSEVLPNFSETSVQSKPEIESPEDSPTSKTLVLADMNQEAVAKAFVAWCEAVIVMGTHKTNHQGALFHRVDEYLALSSPNAFKTFIQSRCVNTPESAYPSIQTALNGFALVNSDSGITVHQVGVKGGKHMNMMLLPLSDKVRAKLPINPMLEWPHA
ncbi:MobH family relaxase [Vibrio echinoideorum]